MGKKFFGLKILAFFDVDPDPESFRPGIRKGKIRTRDPGLTSRIRNNGESKTKDYFDFKTVNIFPVSCEICYILS
jgi:hypothetical protein